MLVSEEARVFQVRGLRCSKEPTVLGLSPVRLGNRTYRAWGTAKLTPMVRRKTRPTGPGVNYLIYFRTDANAISEESVRFGFCKQNREKLGSRGTGTSANRCLLRKSYIFLTSCEKSFSRQ